MTYATTTFSRKKNVVPPRLNGSSNTFSASTTSKSTRHPRKLRCSCHVTLNSALAFCNNYHARNRRLGRKTVTAIVEADPLRP